MLSIILFDRILNVLLKSLAKDLCFIFVYLYQFINYGLYHCYVVFYYIFINSNIYYIIYRYNYYCKNFTTVLGLFIVSSWMIDQINEGDISFLCKLLYKYHYSWIFVLYIRIIYCIFVLYTHTVNLMMQ